MKAQAIQKAMEKLSILKGQPLRFVFRSMDMTCFEFGEVVTKEVFGRDENGKAALVKEEAGKYALHVQSYFRISYGSDLLLVKGDMFQPSNKVANTNEYNEDEFDWAKEGSNRFDEIVAQHFLEPSAYVVNEISMNKLGDLKIKFENGFKLEILMDVSGPEECWRFFQAENEEHLTITGQGIATEDADTMPAI